MSDEGPRRSRSRSRSRERDRHTGGITSHMAEPGQQHMQQHRNGDPAALISSSFGDASARPLAAVQLHQLYASFQPLAASASLHFSPSAARRTFTSVSYGEVAQLIAHCLTLSDLAAWSRCNKDGRAAMERKLNNFMHLSLADYPDMQPAQFELLCDRVAGLEVLILPLSHPSILVPLDENFELQWRCPGAISLLHLMRRNVNSLAVVCFDGPFPTSFKSLSYRIVFLSLIECSLH
jgi:hypothetical protein